MPAYHLCLFYLSISPTTASILTVPSKLRRLATSGYTGVRLISDLRNYCPITCLAQRVITNRKKTLFESADIADFGCIVPSQSLG